MNVIILCSAGVAAAGLTNPLDVAKTRLQTQGDVGKTYKVDPFILILIFFFFFLLSSI
jgi:hypothetical protein